MKLDIHAHILPGIDDGSENVETSLCMLETLAADGVTDIVFTPHFYFHEKGIEHFLEKRERAMGQLASGVPEGIQVHLGAEVEFSNVSIGYGQFKLLSIDGGKYILLELPMQEDLEGWLYKRLARFIDSTNLNPIIAHAERYKGLQKRPNLIAELINLGCLIQVNTTSIINSKHGDLVDAMLKKDMLHLLGSDCHNMRDRKPDYARAIKVIETRYGDEKYAAIAQISQCVINNEPLHLTTENNIQNFFGHYK